MEDRPVTVDERLQLTKKNRYSGVFCFGQENMKYNLE
jgi:hypothetical protein